MPDTLKRLQAALAGRYRIDRELGRGGMAFVFLAHDIQHDRPVALKVLQPELAAALGGERFEREIKLVARLQHPHILGVHDSGDADGLLWFTMPFVEGESLRHRLNRERQFPIDDAVRVVREAALALDYAHRHGVVHRDIKPENILLSDDQALVADFGVARAVQGGESLTQTGLAIGTPAYMSPEQAGGEKTLDGRTDVYSLGCVLYELLAGEPPFTGPTPQAVITRALTETPRSLSVIRASVSSHLTSIVARAMARAPADRYPTAAEFARALNLPTGQTPVVTQTTARPGTRQVAIWAVAIGLIVLATTAWLLRRSGGAPHPSGDDQKRIAVLPFENEGGAEDDYFADGVADEVRTKLASVPKLQVIARSSSTQYRKTGKSAKEIGRELEVDYLLTGTVRWSRSSQAANRVRVNPELIDVSTSSTRWTEAFERDLSDVFAVQTDIASKVAQSLDIALGSTAQQRLAVRPTTDMAAWDAYLRGEQITQSMGVVDEKVLRQGLEHYGRAVELDSNFAEAWARLGLAQVELERSNSTPEGTERARIAVERGFRLAPDKTETRLAMGRYLRIIKRDYQGAVDQFTKGLKADPNNAVLLTGAASAEQVLGRWDDAVAHLQLAAKLDPRSVLTARSLAYVLHDVRRYPEANAESDRALALSPANTAVIQQKATNYLSMGWLDSSRSVVRQALTHVDTTAILVRFSKFQEQMWVLDPSLWPLIVKLTPADFDGDRGHWGLKVGGTWILLGDSARARIYADSARIAFEKQLRGFPENAQLHELRGRALALGGHKREAIEEAERSLRMRETELDASTGPYVRFQVARILIQAGSYERALDLIEPLLSENGSDLTPGYLRLDPSFKPLYNNPRFQKLVAGN